MARKAWKSDRQGKLFGPEVEQLELCGEGAAPGSVEALGRQFASQEERREHFAQRLERKLADHDFRGQDGFPKGSDTDVLRLSDPPWYTACPNPFVREFVEAHGRPYNPLDGYHREPFNADTSAGKTDPLYKAHGYHTKVPHLAIVPFLLHYTEPGDLVLDGFCGSGMTGIAAQWCGSAPREYRGQLEAEWEQLGRGKPKWGARRAILNDLSPAATFIAANYNLPFDMKAFSKAAQRLLDEVEEELGWMYETNHVEGHGRGRINYTVWSEVFACPECGGDVVFLEQALDPETKRVRETFRCPHCDAELAKGRTGGDGGSSGSKSKVGTVERKLEMVLDPATGNPQRRVKLVPVLINYTVADERYEKRPDSRDLELLERIARSSMPAEVPVDAFPTHAPGSDRCRSSGGCCHSAGLAPKGFTHVHHLFLPRAAQALGALWRRARAQEDARIRNMLLWFVEQAIWTMSMLNRYRPTGFSQVSQYLSGVYYIGSQNAELSPWYVLDGKLKRLQTTFPSRSFSPGQCIVTTGTGAHIPISDQSIDYIFTDPPFGENLNYADLNFLVEAWHGLITDVEPEAIVDLSRQKELRQYQELMHACFAEYFRVLKPGRWMTMVFSNSSNLVWNAIQEAMGEAGFVVAEVRTLDKKQASFRQVTSTAMKTDLLVSAFKPSERLTRKIHEDGGVWNFVRELLEHLSPVVRTAGRLEVQVERTRQGLFDRVVAFYVQHRLPIPVSAAEFFAGLRDRFEEEDGMFFLPAQRGQYLKARAQSQDDPAIPLFIRDEKSAIQWVRAQLERKPQTQQDLTPDFYKAQTAWDRHERGVELRSVLEDHFDRYEGNGPVPGPIHAYLSKNYHDLRNLSKEHPDLREKARDRWYVPDPGRAEELERRNRRGLLREFETYRDSKKNRLKDIRKEVIRVGFADAYERQDFQAVVDVADRLPESMLEDDFELYMYVNNARTLVGG